MTNQMNHTHQGSNLILNFATVIVFPNVHTLTPTAKHTYIQVHAHPNTYKHTIVLQKAETHFSFHSNYDIFLTVTALRHQPSALLSSLISLSLPVSVSESTAPTVS